MSSLIPHLRELVYQQNEWEVPADFVVSFLQLHGVSAAGADGSARGWRVAQDHWEKVVALALQTDAVERNARGREAMRQAVVAAVQLLDVYRLRRGRCALCPRLMPAASVEGGAQR